MESLTKLYEKRARVHEQMKDRARDWEGMVERGEEIPNDQNAEFDKWNNEYDNLTGQIQRLEKLNNIEAREDGRHTEDPKPQEVDAEAEYKEAFRKYVIYGEKRMTDRELEVIAERFKGKNESRAATASSTTAAAGGYTIPEDFSYEIEKFMEYTGPFANFSGNGPFRLWTSDTGADLPWPTVDDTANDGYLLAESGDATTSATGVTFGTELLKAYAFNTGVIPVTRQIMQDSFTQFSSLLAELFGERMGRAVNTAATTGTGSSQPEGVVLGSSQGKVSASGTAFTQNEMIDLLYSVNKAYRMGPKVGWMLHSSMVGNIRKLDVSTSNYTQPLFQPSLSQGVPDKILGYQYWENDAMASALTTGQKIMLFGDFSKFVIRRVRGFEILRSDERYFELLQVAFMGWLRFDSRVMNTNAIKYLELT